ncbi:sugar ABC transporter ATP-binding protein [Ruminococcus gauvreauii]|uniref:Sugar ABC transporter ATP-binding protein n=1 Tax=Ruminococcus gauvreauii TaxID=438033 RepID=A0ABY5VBR3_9FIRM|nr:sugar ABC transporter ATP-binding protein [Ruminococcus gauvreauii]UWP57934.1 sugar ABC transporter ATP-binding protein [Ruminococcus gauvreauii]
MPFIEFEGITKKFPGTVALDSVSLAINKGDIVALCGENGAGKSTLGKVFVGVYPYGSYDGVIKIEGKEVKFTNTLDAEKSGVVMVHQELNLVDEMTVAENISLGNMPHKVGKIDFETMEKVAVNAMQRLGVEIDPGKKLGDLSISMQQMVEIAKAISRNPHTIIFDEATSSLTNSEVETLFAVMRRLKKEEITMIYVTHKMDEIYQICNRVVILKDGKYVNEGNTSEVTKDTLISWMIGRKLEDMFAPKTKQDYLSKKPILEIKNWSVYKEKGSAKKVVDHANLTLRPGEILGIYGLMGAGRTELVTSIFEGNDVPSEGEIFLDGEKIKINTTSDAIRTGIALLTEDRRNSGLITIHSILDNIILASIKNYVGKFFRRDSAREREAARSMVHKLRIKLSSLDTAVSSLSGGNQQKVVLSKWLLTNPRILILDEPTRGIDVGAKKEIYHILQELADKGVGIIVVSSELPEVLGISDRVMVMREGQIAGEIFVRDATEEILVRYAMEGKYNG